MTERGSLWGQEGNIHFLSVRCDAYTTAGYEEGSSLDGMNQLAQWLAPEINKLLEKLYDRCLLTTTRKILRAMSFRPLLHLYRTKTS